MVYYAWPSKLIVYLKLFYKSNRPHFLWVYWLDNPLGMLGEHSKSLQTWSSQSIKIGMDLSIDKSIKIGKRDLIDINNKLYQLIGRIDDTLVSSIDL